MKALTWLLLGIAASAISWTYMHKVLLPWERYSNVDRGKLKSQMGDLYPRWVGTRELLLHIKNPYSAEVSHEIQIGFYGHPIEQSYDKPQSEIIDEQRFAYPIYTVFLLAPTIYVDFESVQAWAPWVLGAFVLAGLLLWLALLRWQQPWWVVVALILIVLSSPQIAQGLRLRQLGLFAVFLLALAAWCVTRNRLGAAGFVLALATIKPQMVALAVAWFLLWSLGDWKRRWTLAGGFVVGLGALAGAGDLLVAGWVSYFLDGLEAYRRYFPTTSTLRLILGNWIGGFVSIAAILVLFGYGWTRRRVMGDSADFVQVLSLFFVTSLLVLPLLTPYNQLLLLLPVLTLIRDWTILPRWAQAGLSLLAGFPYVVSAILLIYPPQLNAMQRTQLLPSALLLLVPFFIPIVMFVRSQKNAPEPSPKRAL